VAKRTRHFAPHTPSSAAAPAAAGGNTLTLRRVLHGGGVEDIACADLADVQRKLKARDAILGSGVFVGTLHIRRDDVTLRCAEGAARFVLRAPAGNTEPTLCVCAHSFCARGVRVDARADAAHLHPAVYVAAGARNFTLEECVINGSGETKSAHPHLMRAMH
jgi:hypothetical protein